MMFGLFYIHIQKILKFDKLNILCYTYYDYQLNQLNQLSAVKRYYKSGVTGQCDCNYMIIMELVIYPCVK